MDLGMRQPQPSLVPRLLSKAGEEPETWVDYVIKGGEAASSNCQLHARKSQS